MKIYGNKNISRGIKVGEIDYKDFNDKNTAIGFIREHGMFGAYISKIDAGYEDEVSIDTSPDNIDMESVEYKGIKYWYGNNPYDVELSLGMYRKIGVYRQLPNIYDDKMFHWKRNKKYGSMECTIEDKVFEFHCIYMVDGNAIINVKYCACDNLHRNKVTMAMIEVEYATNEVILKGIKKWKKEFRESLRTA